MVSCYKGEGKFPRFAYNGTLNNISEGNEVCLNGAMFFLAPEDISNPDWSIGAQPYYMSRDSSIDIDDKSDWEQAVRLFQTKL